MLTDDLTLSTAGLENNSVVHLVERAPPVTTTSTNQSESESTNQQANNESNENESAASSESWDDRIASKKVKKENDIETHEDSRGANIRNSSLTGSLFLCC